MLWFQGEGESRDLLDELPTIVDAVNTSMVSHRWRHLWLTRRNLVMDTPNIFGSRHVGPVYEFDNTFHSRSQKQEFARRVNTFLHLYQGNKVDSFKVTYFFNPESESAAILDEWIRFAITKGVEVLELRLFRIFPESNKYYVFPHWLLSQLNSSSTIKYLSLFRCALRPPVPFVDGFNQLRTLFLDYVDVDEKFISHLFTVCLFLESLTLKYCNVGSHLIVVGPSLHLNDFNVIYCYRLTKVEIYAVNITSLEFAGKEFNIVSIRAPRLDQIYFLARGGGETLPSTLTEFASFPVLEKLHLQMNTVSSDLFLKHTIMFSSFLTFRVNVYVQGIPQRLPTFSNLKLLNLDLLSCRNRREDVDLVPVLNLLKVAPLLEQLNMTVKYIHCNTKY